MPTEWLLPADWLTLASPDQCHFFNPALLDWDGRLIMAYRVVLPDLRRRIAICELNDAFEPVPHSAVPVSDHLLNAGTWHADPRFCRFGDRLLLHFNSGAEVPNNIFMVEIDPRTFLPRGPCRHLVVDHPRQPVEKNWMFFEHACELFAVYSIAPHRVHRVQLDSDDDRIRCVSAYSTAWKDSAYAATYGTPRGSTPPVQIGTSFFSFFHSQYRKKLPERLRNHITSGTGLRVNSYGVGVYAFRAVPPFVPQLLMPKQVLNCPLRPRSNRPVLSSSYDTCCYPSGAVLRNGEWTVSMGLHDDGCALVRISHDSIVRACEPARLQ